jgi:beta-1,2-mannobiose phosphorylase / 1,2-beta-oligomannan phosphorylase
MKIIDKLLLKPEDFKPSFKGWSIEGVLNPAAIRLENKKIALFVRIAEKAGDKQGNMHTCPVISSSKKYDVNIEKISKGRIWKRDKAVIFLKDGSCRLTTISHIRKVILDKDGFEINEINNSPYFVGRPDDGDYGVEDSRIVNLDGGYAMTYVSVSRNEGVSTSLALSKNLRSWKRKGIIFREQNKDAVLFPRKIKGKYVALHRPESTFEFSKPSIWIAYSPDLEYWGREKSIIRPRLNSWESERVGAGPPPIETKEGWLLIYHGVKKKTEGLIYCAGAALLDLKNPEKVLSRSPKDQAILKPNKWYEETGFINNVVFPSGAVPSQDKKHLLIYSGGADRFTSVKKIAFKDILNSLE